MGLGQVHCHGLLPNAGKGSSWDFLAVGAGSSNRCRNGLEPWPAGSHTEKGGKNHQHHAFYTLLLSSRKFAFVTQQIDFENSLDSGRERERKRENVCLYTSKFQEINTCHNMLLLCLKMLRE